MQTWKAVILLTAAHHGLTPEATEPLFPMLESRTRKILRSIGHSHEEIDEEFPDGVLEKCLCLLRSDPVKFNEKLFEAAAILCSRN